VGKSRQFEIVGESDKNELIRFLLHFLFVSHEYFNLELFDTKEDDLLASVSDNDFAQN